MKNLSFNEGYERFMINDDPSRVIKFNPADPEIINRILSIQERFSDYHLPDDIELKPDGTPKNDMEKEGAYIAEFTSKIRNAFNDIFNADVYDTIFNGQSPLCIVSGQFLFEGVLDGLIKIIKPEVEEYQKKLQNRMGKYLGDIE